jgi:predicted protein tyrosine phosphatase
MAILVCPLSRVTAMIAVNQPARVISLLDPGWMFPELGPEYADRHLRLAFHDAHAPANEQTVPSFAHVRTLLAFLATCERHELLLIHCRAGIGRSTAAAFIAACVAYPDIDEARIAAALRRASPLARPNEVLVFLADQEMGRAGRMHRAIASTGLGLPAVQADENEPFELRVPFRDSAA